jgi:hypothetical protein
MLYLKTLFNYVGYTGTLLKVNLSLVSLHHQMKTYGGVDVKLLQFSILTFDSSK